MNYSKQKGPLCISKAIKCLVFSVLINGVLSAKGPSDPEKVGYCPGEYMVPKIIEPVPKKYGEETIKRVFKDELPIKLEYVAWYNHLKEIRQVYIAGATSKENFFNSIKVLKLKQIETPIRYLKSLHAFKESILCYEGNVNGMPSHFLWLKYYDEFMLVCEIPKSNAEKELNSLENGL